MAKLFCSDQLASLFGWFSTEEWYSELDFEVQGSSELGEHLAIELEDVLFKSYSRSIKAGQPILSNEFFPLNVAMEGKNTLQLPLPLKVSSNDKLSGEINRVIIACSREDKNTDRLIKILEPLPQRVHREVKRIDDIRPDDFKNAVFIVSAGNSISSFFLKYFCSMSKIPALSIGRSNDGFRDLRHLSARTEHELIFFMNRVLTSKGYFVKINHSASLQMQRRSSLNFLRGRYETFV